MGRAEERGSLGGWVEHTASIILGDDEREFD